MDQGFGMLSTDIDISSDLGRHWTGWNITYSRANMVRIRGYQSMWILILSKHLIHTWNQLQTGTVMPLIPNKAVVS